MMRLDLHFYRSYRDIGHDTDSPSAQTKWFIPEGARPCGSSLLYCRRWRYACRPLLIRRADTAGQVVLPEVMAVRSNGSNDEGRTFPTD